LLSEAIHEDRRRLFSCRSRDDGVGRGLEFSGRQPWLARADGVGGVGISIRDFGDALVLDRRHPGDAVPRPRDDAVLLHLQNTFSSRLPATALWRTVARVGG